jgi:hypothetical protein
MPSTAIGVDTVSALSRQYVMPEIVDAVYDSNVLFHRLTKANKKVVQGGTHIEVPIQYARPNNAQAYSGYDVLNTAPFDVIKNAVFDWKQYATLVTVDGLTLIKTDNPEAIAQLIKTQFELAKADFCHVLGTDLYRGNASDPQKLTGLAQAVAASGTYGGINHSNTYWQAKVDSSTALSALDLSGLQVIFSQLTIGRESPTLMIGRRTVYNKLWNLIYGSSGANVQISVPAGGADELLASAGFTNILFNNVPLVVDSQVDDSTGTATNGKLYMLNENWFELAVSPRADMAMEDFVTPHDQDAMTAKILFAGELICKNPRLQGAFTAL